jgi:hypothetical protein
MKPERHHIRTPACTGCTDTSHVDIDSQSNRWHVDRSHDSLEFFNLPKSLPRQDLIVAISHLLRAMLTSSSATQSAMTTVTQNLIIIGWPYLGQHYSTMGTILKIASYRYDEATQFASRPARLAAEKDLIHVLAHE